MEDAELRTGQFVASIVVRRLPKKHQNLLANDTNTVSRNKKKTGMCVRIATAKAYHAPASKARWQALKGQTNQWAGNDRFYFKTSSHPSY